MDRCGLQRLRVLIIGQQNSFDHVLAANIQCRGHEVVVLPSAEWLTKMDVAAAGDVLLYDLDAAFHIQPATGEQNPGLSGRGSARSAVASPAALSMKTDLRGLQDASSLAALSGVQRRFTIAMSSDSVSRLALEQINAVALLYKPFEMGLLQRYFHVLQRLLLEQQSQLPATAKGERTRVLVVDDDEAVARTIERCLLDESRYAVAVAHNGLEALEQFLDWHPRCVVTDLLMPWMNGYQVIRCLAGVPGTLPGFVVMSALHQHEVLLDRAYLAGNTVEYIDKPFQVSHLLSAVERACSA